MFTIVAEPLDGNLVGRWAERVVMPHVNDNSGHSTISPPSVFWLWLNR